LYFNPAIGIPHIETTNLIKASTTSSVYQIKDSPNRVLKFVRDPHVAADEIGIYRLIRSLPALANHDHILQLVDDLHGVHTLVLAPRCVSSLADWNGTIDGPRFAALMPVFQLLHSQHIFHRDARSANIMVHESGRLVLGDFGFAVHLEPSQTAPFSVTNNRTNNVTCC
jgi:serine/threonine protein kinase